MVYSRWYDTYLSIEYNEIQHNVIQKEIKVHIF
jgi:hypothetical protein